MHTLASLVLLFILLVVAHSPRKRIHVLGIGLAQSKVSNLQISQDSGKAELEGYTKWFNMGKMRNVGLYAHRNTRSPVFPTISQQIEP